MRGMASAAAFASHTCSTTAAAVSAIPTAFTSAPPSVLSEKMTLPRRIFPTRLLALSPRSTVSRIDDGTYSGAGGGTFSVVGLSHHHHHHHDAGARHRRSCAPTALYCIQRDYFSPTTHSEPLPTSLSCSSSSGSSSSNVDSCFANGLTGGRADTDENTGSRRRRRRRGSTRLTGLRKARGVDGPPSDGGEDPDREGDGGGGNKVTPAARSSRGPGLYGSSIPASKRQPPEEDDIWSKHSVFEFKSLNDPDTNACGYKGLSGQPSGPSSTRRRTSSSSSQQEQGPAPELRLTSDQQTGNTIFDGVDDLLEAERPASRTAIDDDFFKFREKEALVGTTRRREVERRRRGAAGGGGGGGGTGGTGAGSGGRSERSAVKVELATQLGVPATSTYGELRTAYRVEIKRCHPDLAGNNEFRVKFLERKFQKLQGCWDKFNAEQTAAATGGGGRSAAAEAEAGGGGGSSSQASRARARAREEAREQQAAAAAAVAAAQRSRRPVMDQGRNIMDDGNSSSC